MAKAVAGTLTTILDHPVMRKIMNRAEDVHKEVVPKTLEVWSYDLFARKPGPAVTEDGKFVGTDLDLACFMHALCERNAVINIPQYTSRRVATKRAGEIITSKQNRHGQITGLTSNKEALSFGLRITDFNVITTDPITHKQTVGAPRNFMLVDVDGEWYDGWQTIEFTPTAKENTFLTDKKLWTDNKVIFKNFIHPNRWISFFGSYYFLTKVLIQRLEEEAHFYKLEIDRLLAAGIKYPPTGEQGAPQTWPESEKVGQEKKITVNAFAAEVDVPDFTGDYPKFPDTQAGLLDATQRRKTLIYGTTPRLRFAARTVEKAFLNHATDPLGKCTRMPGWIEDATWEEAYREKGKRTDWFRLVLFQPAVGEQGVALRYRTWKKTETVSAD